MGDSIGTTISSENGKRLAQLAIELKVPRSTLGHRRKGRLSRSEGHATQMALSKEEEEELAASIERLCDWNWAPTKVYIRSMAASLRETRGDLFGFDMAKH